MTILRLDVFVYCSNGETVAEAVPNQSKTSSSKERATNRTTMLDMKKKKKIWVIVRMYTVVA